MGKKDFSPQKKIGKRGCGIPGKKGGPLPRGGILTGGPGEFLGRFGDPENPPKEKKGGKGGFLFFEPSPPFGEFLSIYPRKE